MTEGCISPLQRTSDSNNDIPVLEYPFCTEDLKRWNLEDAMSFAKRNDIDCSRAESKDEIVELLKKKFKDNEGNNGDIVFEEVEKKIQKDTERYEKYMEIILGYHMRASSIVLKVERDVDIIKFLAMFCKVIDDSGDVEKIKSEGDRVDGTKNDNIVETCFKNFFSKRLPDESAETASEAEDVEDEKEEIDNQQNELPKDGFELVKSILDTKSSEIRNKQINISVIGEAGAGKSTLINCLIGSDVLPTDDDRHCTKAIIRVYNDDEKKIEIKTGQKKESIAVENENDLKSKLENINEKSHDTSFIDVHWSFPFLKGNLVIVDTPGNNATEDAEKFVSDFLPSATAIIVVIDASHRGGMPVDVIRRIEKLSKSRHFKPECVFFIYNKWDRLQKKNRQKVFHENETKMRGKFPWFLQENVKTIDAKEATRKYGEKIFFSRSYRGFLDSLSELIEAAFKRNVRRHSIWVLKMIIELGNFLQIAQPETKKKEFQKQVEQYNKKTEEMTKKAKEICDKVTAYIQRTRKHEAKQLFDHLQSEETFCRLTDYRNDFPTFSELYHCMFSRFKVEIYDWLLKRSTISTVEEYISQEVNKFESELNTICPTCSMPVCLPVMASWYYKVPDHHRFGQFSRLINLIYFFEKKKSIKYLTKQMIQSTTIDDMLQMTKSFYEETANNVQSYFKREIPSRLTMEKRLMEIVFERKNTIGIDYPKLLNLCEKLVEELIEFVQSINLASEQMVLNF